MKDTALSMYAESNMSLSVDAKKQVLPIDVAKKYLDYEPLPDWIKKIVRDGISSVEDLPVPDAKTEDWRETNLSHFFNPKVHWEHLSEAKGATEFKIPEIYTENFVPDIVYVNGRITTGQITKLENKNLKISTLRQRCIENGESLESVLNGIEEPKHLFEALSRAFLFDALVVEVPKNVVIDLPINIYLPVSEVDKDILDTPWLILILNDNSQAEVLVHYVDGRERIYSSVWVNATEVIKVGANSHLKYLSTYSGGQDTYRFISTYAHLEKDSSVSYNSLLLSGKFIRSELNFELRGENVSTTINGLSVNEKVNHSETQQLIEHLMPNCTSRINWRGVGKDESKTLYRGKIYISPEAQKSDSIQLFKGLSLSDRAVIDAKPQLEIYADDVRCTHGATVGPPPKDLVFYFQSRGINRSKAQKLLVSAFVKEVLSLFPFGDVERLVLPFLESIYE